MELHLPPFDKRGNIPAGDYECTFKELRESVLVQGPPDCDPADWDSVWRRKLVDNAEIMVNQLWAVGIDEVYLGGTFLEHKAHPSDIDGYFNVDEFEWIKGTLQDKLNELDPHYIWHWNPATRTPYPGKAAKQLPMWHVYRVELYPNYEQWSGVFDDHGNELTFPALFRRSRAGKPRGILKLRRG